MLDLGPQAQCHGLRDGLTPRMGPNPADLIALDLLGVVQAPSHLTVHPRVTSVIVDYLNVDRTRIRPSEIDPILVIDPDVVLRTSLAVSSILWAAPLAYASR